MAALTLNSIRLSTLALGAALALTAPALAADVSVQLDAGAGFSVKNSTGAIERLRVDEATGNISRNGALFVHTTGTNNTFVGVNAGNTATTGFANSAVGVSALSSNTTGFDNSAVGYAALRSNTTGRYNSAVGYAALRSNTNGGRNSAFGYGALFSNTTGQLNSAVGNDALRANTTGSRNSAFGNGALFSNGTGKYNSAFGYRALTTNFTGNYNTAVGYKALLENSTGNYNTAVGYRALDSNSAGFRNIAVGSSAGINQTTGANNIYLANPGVAAEGGQIKIGTVGTHTGATIAGIHSATSTVGIAVLVNASGKLGTTTSSLRFKTDVHDMQSASDVLMQLRPVVFHYREDAVGAEEAKIREYGLIAEEVANVAPELVAPDLDGKPYSVRYHVLPSLLLNEAQKQHATLEAQRRINEEQQRTIEAQRQEMQTQKREQQAEIAALTTRLARLETRN